MIELISPNIIIELFSTILAFIYLMKDKIWKIFIPYLIFVTLSELLGRYIAVYGNGYNSWLYNITMVIEIGIINLMFANLLKTYRKAQLMIYLGLALTVLTYAYDLLTHGFLVYNANTRSLFSFLMIIYALIYFYTLLKQESYVLLKHYAPFWWVSGVLLYYSGSMISNLTFMIIDSYILNKYPLRYVTFILLNLILYSLWSYSFYCRHRQKMT